MSRLVALCLASLPLLVSCDLLSTRDPQSPVQQSNYRSPTSPDLVIQNLQNAVNGRDAASYGKCFVDSTHLASGYRFLPAGDAQQFAATFSNWSVREEISYFLNLKSQVPATATLALFVDSLQTVSASSDSMVYSAAYTMIAQHTSGGIPTEARGHLHWSIKSDPITSLWGISQWTDIANPSDPSWSILKARFSP